MIVPREDFKQLYEAIKDDIQSSQDKKVTIFVSALEADSICALRILQGILEVDGVHHSIYPVSGYSQVVTIFKEQLNDDDIKNVMFINFGACEDLLQMLDSQENTRLIVVDSRRPINHNLIGDPNNRAVLIADPDDVHPSGQQGLPDPDGYSDAEASDYEDDKENMPEAKRRRTDAGSQSVEEEERLARKERKKQRKQEVRRRRRNYYEYGSFWGCPAALTFLRLAQDLHQSDKHCLWLGAVGLTDQLVHQRIAPEKYADHAIDLETEIGSEGGPENEATIKVQVDTDDGFVEVDARNPATRVTAVKDLRFALMRHWSLYDSMLHSTNVAIRIQSWQDKGRRKLEELLTRMGFRIKECKLDFSEMRILIHQQLEKKLEKFGHTAQLSDLAFQSFHLHWGYRTPLSATDAVYGVSALMESHATKPHEQLMSSDSFWHAWKALNPSDGKEMRNGLEIAKQVQRAVLMDGGLLISQQQVKFNRVYGCVDISRSSITNKVLLSQPMALVKLGVFLREGAAFKKPDRLLVPFILFGPATPERTCLVVSISRKPSISTVEGNNFPMLMAAAARAAGCELNLDGFDTCVSVVPLDSVDRLMNEMQIAAQKYI